ncbi:hypothetical protein [Palleronia sp.]|uniref:hypothetical protein n=1 Tax=Palleronia sp. TaxID=1940284 RepID=UPI0035C831E1
MRRALIVCCLAAGCGMPDLDTPATRAGAVGSYPEIAPRAEILSRVTADATTGTVADLSARSARLASRDVSAQGGTVDRAGILGRADALQARALGVRNVKPVDDASAAADLRQRADAIRSSRGTPAVPPPPTAEDVEAAERLRRLRRLRDGTGDDPL